MAFLASSKGKWHCGEETLREDRKRSATVQFVVSMIEDDLVPMALDEGIGIISYNPLAGGMLSGRYGKDARIEEGTRFGLRTRRGSTTRSDIERSDA